MLSAGDMEVVRSDPIYTLTSEIECRDRFRISVRVSGLEVWGMHILLLL